MHQDISKREIIDQLKELETRAKRFELNKGRNEHFAVAIVSVGHVLDRKQENHVKILEHHRALKVKKASDKSEYYPQFILTH